MRAWAPLVAAILVGCVARTPAPIAHPQAPVRLATREAIPSPPPLPPAVTGIVESAKRATAAATAYVLQPTADPAIIDRLALLTMRLDRGVATLHAHERRGRYRHDDVIAVQAAVDAVDACIGSGP